MGLGKWFIKYFQAVINSIFQVGVNKYFIKIGSIGSAIGFLSLEYNYSCLGSTTPFITRPSLLSISRPTIITLPSEST
jgi:hypothetical protein